MQKVREKRVVLSRAQSDAEDNHHREEEKPEKSAITREKTKTERTKGEERGGGKGKEERLWGRRRPPGAGGCVGDGEETNADVRRRAACFDAVDASRGRRRRNGSGPAREAREDDDAGPGGARPQAGADGREPGCGEPRRVCFVSDGRESGGRTRAAGRERARDRRGGSNRGRFGRSAALVAPAPVPERGGSRKYLPPAALARSSATFVLASPALRAVLELALALGNALNGGTPRGGAYGFAIEGLHKLATIKALDGRETLLHFLVARCETAAEAAAAAEAGAEGAGTAAPAAAAAAASSATAPSPSGLLF